MRARRLARDATDQHQIKAEVKVETFLGFNPEKKLS